jgi:hypothetical protein
MSCPVLPAMPPPVGTAVWFKPGFNSAVGGAVFSINGSPFTPVVKTSGDPITLGDTVANAWLLLFFDGGAWQVIAGYIARQPPAAPGQPTVPALNANANWYVNKGSGSDSYDGTSATVQSATVGPFQTLQRAANETAKYNMNGYSQTVHVADGAYNAVGLGPTNGVGTVYWVGDDAAPQQCSITATAANQGAFVQNGGNYSIEGFRLSATGSGVSDGIAVGAAGQLKMANVFFGPCTSNHITTAQGASISITGGNIGIEANANAQTHISAQLNSLIARDPFNLPNLTIYGAVNFSSAFIQAVELGIAQMHYNSMSGKAAVTGPMYSASGNAIVDSLAGGASYFPGNAAGALTYGGQYLP